MSADVLIDNEAIENLKALNPEDADGFVRDLVSIYLEDTPQRIAELKEALATGDGSKFTRAAHSIKGSSSNMGAAQLRAIAEKMEHDSRHSGVAGMEAYVAQTEAIFKDTKAALERLVGA